jgi:hypothetical protein
MLIAPIHCSTKHSGREQVVQLVWYKRACTDGWLATGAWRRNGDNNGQFWTDVKMTIYRRFIYIILLYYIYIYIFIRVPTCNTNICLFIYRIRKVYLINILSFWCVYVCTLTRRCNGGLVTTNPRKNFIVSNEVSVARSPSPFTVTSYIIVVHRTRLRRVVNT